MLRHLFINQNNSYYIHDQNAYNILYNTKNDERTFSHSNFMQILNEISTIQQLVLKK